MNGRGKVRRRAGSEEPGEIWDGNLGQEQLVITGREGARRCSWVTVTRNVITCDTVQLPETGREGTLHLHSYPPPNPPRNGRRKQKEGESVCAGVREVTALWSVPMRTP